MLRLATFLALASLLSCLSLAAQSPPAPSQAARTDQYGDPLPPAARARLGTIRFRHGGPVGVLAFAPDGKSLLSSSLDGSFVLWETATGRVRYRLTGNFLHTPGSRHFSPDGKTLTFLGSDRRICLYDSATGKEVSRLSNPAKDSWQVAISADFRRVALLEGNQMLRLWDVKADKELRQLQGPVVAQPGQQPFAISYFAFTPDGKFLAAISTRGQEGMLRVWDLATYRERAPLPWPTANLQGLMFSPDSKTLLIDDRKGRVHFVDLMTGNKLQLAAGVKHLSQAVAYSADGKMLALANGADGIVLVNPANGQILRKLPAPMRGCFSLAFSRDGSTLAVGGGDHLIRLLDVATGREMRPPVGPEDALTVAIYSPDGRTIATTGADLTVRLWDAGTGKELHRLTSPAKDAQPRQASHLLAFQRSGRVLVAVWPDRMVGAWETATGKEIYRGNIGKKGSLPLAFSPDGKAVATRGLDGAIEVYTIPGGRQLRRFISPQDSGQRMPSAVAFAPDARTLVLGYGAPVLNQFNNPRLVDAAVLFQPAQASGLVRLWEFSTGRERQEIGFGGATNPILIQSAFRGGASWAPMSMDSVTAVTQVAFSPSSRILAIGANATLVLWDLDGNRELRRIEDSFQGSKPAFSPDGRLLALGGYAGFTLLSIPTGKVLCRATGHQGQVTSLAFSPDGTSLVTGAGDTSALIWDVQQLLDEGQRQRAEPSPERLEQLWADLVKEDAKQAYRAVWALAAAPGRSVPFLKARLRPVPRIDAAALEKLVADLNSPRYAVRQQAMGKLEALGEVAELALRQALERGPSLELRRRVEPLLEKVEAPLKASELLRALRAVEALERAGTPEARAVLAELAGGAPQARLTREAREALERLDRRRVSTP